MSCHAFADVSAPLSVMESHVSYFDESLSGKPFVRFQEFIEGVCSEIVDSCQSICLLF